MANALVLGYVNLEKELWGGLLGKHGYENVETDTTSDGAWKDGSRNLGKVAFWKTVDKDGIIVHHVKMDYFGSTAHGTGIYSVGGAQNYFKSMGYTDEMSAGKRKVEINGRKIPALEYDSIDFHEFLKSKK